MERMVPFAISAKALAAKPEKWVIMTRPSLVRDYGPAGVTPTPDDAWSWSMWRGYLKNSDGVAVQTWFDAGGARAAHIHTSGHASPSDLRAFAKSMDPRWLVPIHGLAWDDQPEGFPPIRRLRDGEPLSL